MATKDDPTDKPQKQPDAPAAKPTREQLLAALAAATGQQTSDEEYHSRIVIKPDGEVLIENLSMDLMELALLLDPEAEVACELPEPEEP